MSRNSPVGSNAANKTPATGTPLRHSPVPNLAANVGGQPSNGSLQTSRQSPVAGATAHGSVQQLHGLPHNSRRSPVDSSAANGSAQQSDGLQQNSRHSPTVSTAVDGSLQQSDGSQQALAGDNASATAVQQPAVVVSSRMIELLQPKELQAMFVGALSIGLMTGSTPLSNFH